MRDAEAQGLAACQGNSVRAFLAWTDGVMYNVSGTNCEHARALRHQRRGKNTLRCATPDCLFRVVQMGLKAAGLPMPVGEEGQPVSGDRPDELRGALRQKLCC